MRRRFCGWSDESSHNKGRFRAIGMISHPGEMKNEIETDINNIIANFVHDGRELKFNKIDIPRLKAYKGITDYFFEKANKGQIRADVLRWDIQDSRHNILGRDDNKNLQMMYYKLLFDVISNRWEDGEWSFFPDKNGSINWNELKFHLNIGSSKVNLKKDLNIKTIKEVNSKDNVLIQVADFFTGLSVFSKEHFNIYENYMEEKKGQTRLVPLKNKYKFSKKDKRRCEILDYFNEKCKDLKMGVSLKNKRGLWTPNPKTTNINFWSYEPQVEEDKAPTR